MLPKSAIISSLLAKEYDQILAGSLLVKSEYHRPSKDFRFLFRGNSQHHISYSFAPPKFALLEGWPEKSEPKSDTVAMWLEANDSRVERVSGPTDNRIVEIHLGKENDSGETLRKRIIFELLGAQSTALLVDEDGIIVQATRVSNDQRALKPKKLYFAPDSLAISARSGKETIGSDGDITYSLEFNERSFRVVPAPPAAALDMNFPLTALHAYLQSRSATTSSFAQLKARALGILNREIKRNQKTLAKTESKLQAAEEADRFKCWGDILMAGQGATAVDGVVTLHDFYSDEEIEIPLLEGKSLIETASHYYKKAKKLQRSRGPLEKTREELRAATSRLEMQQSEIAGALDVDRVEELIEDYGISLGGRKSGSTGPEPESSPYYRVFFSSTGAKILVGKSAEGNAHLTFKVARGYDLWFHAQQSPGSHVVLVRLDKNRAPQPAAIREAAQLAAAYSTQKKSQAVSVVYTERRHVRKVRRGAPGQVIPQNVKALVVEPGIPPGVSEAN